MLRAGVYSRGSWCLKAWILSRSCTYLFWFSPPGERASGSNWFPNASMVLALGKCPTWIPQPNLSFEIYHGKYDRNVQRVMCVSSRPRSKQSNRSFSLLFVSNLRTPDLFSSRLYLEVFTGQRVPGKQKPAPPKDCIGKRIPLLSFINLYSSSFPMESQRGEPPGWNSPLVVQIGPSEAQEPQARGHAYWLVVCRDASTPVAFPRESAQHVCPLDGLDVNPGSASSIHVTFANFSSFVWFISVWEPKQIINIIEVPR